VCRRRRERWRWRGRRRGGGGPVTLTLATVNNPQMVDMEQLKGEFEADNPDIKVKFVQMEENDLRDAVTKDVATQGGQYDMVTIGAYEVPLWQQNDWIRTSRPTSRSLRTTTWTT
jgi:sorbitol/mannitol transport system substrate-binding protein